MSNGILGLTVHTLKMLCPIIRELGADQVTKTSRCPHMETPPDKVLELLCSIHISRVRETISRKCKILVCHNNMLKDQMYHGVGLTSSTQNSIALMMAPDTSLTAKEPSRTPRSSLSTQMSILIKINLM